MIRKLLKFIGVLLLVLVAAIAVIVLDTRANIPADTYTIQPAATAGQIVEDDGYLIFGGTRNTGLVVATLLRERGEEVTAFVRETSDRSGLEAIGAKFVVGDAMDVATVRAAFENKNYRAVLTTIGCMSCDPPVDFVANRNVIDATVGSGTRRLLLVTTVGAGNSKDALPWASKRFLAKMLPLKTQAEAHLRDTKLDYTIVRPGGLKSAPGTGNGILTENPDAFGFIFREDLAQLLVAALDDPGTIARTLTAIDGYRRWIWSSE